MRAMAKRRLKPNLLLGAPQRIFVGLRRHHRQGLSTSIQTVQVDAGDEAFHTSRCGNWTYLGP